jgi:hypothetical protein
MIEVIYTSWYTSVWMLYGNFFLKPSQISKYMP